MSSSSSSELLWSPGSSGFSGFSGCFDGSPVGFAGVSGSVFFGGSGLCGGSGVCRDSSGCSVGCSGGSSSSELSSSDSSSFSEDSSGSCVSVVVSSDCSRSFLLKVSKLSISASVSFLNGSSFVRIRLSLYSWIRLRARSLCNISISSNSLEL